MIIPSKAESINAVERLIDDLRTEFDIHEDVYGNMLVAVTEAVNNAIFHGNQSDPAKEVSIKYALADDKMSFTIKDQGPGFDYYNLPDPTAPENLEKPTGRGIFLMKNLADQLIFAEEGRVVELFFKLNSGN
ncbi:MAG: ATP-binding protein [Bacteroidia bacterium]|nr:ATP-binding protein [Bacteroidia bacterium]NNM16912.1 ATP-binding protein [Bacteroidia bacterium]